MPFYKTVCKNNRATPGQLSLTIQLGNIFFLYIYKYLYIHGYKYIIIEKVWDPLSCLKLECVKAYWISQS